MELHPACEANVSYARPKTVTKKDFRRLTKRNSVMSKKSSTRDATEAFPHKRRVIFGLSLLAVLSLTTVLLNAMVRSPMQPDAADTLFAYGGSSDSIDSIFNISGKMQPGRWQYIYIHHSKTASGNALQLSNGSAGLADHFIIGNGEGLADGELQISQRWNHQQSAQNPTGSVPLQPTYISICLVGDFDLNPPTSMQWGRLGQLVKALQQRANVPNNRVQMINDSVNNRPSSPAGIGRYFPIEAFHDQLQNWTNATANAGQRWKN